MTADELSRQLLPMLEELVMVLAELRGVDRAGAPGDSDGDDGRGNHDDAPAGGSAFIPLASFTATGRE